MIKKMQINFRIAKTSERGTVHKLCNAKSANYNVTQCYKRERQILNYLSPSLLLHNLRTVPKPCSSLLYLEYCFL